MSWVMATLAAATLALTGASDPDSVTAVSDLLARGATAEAAGDAAGMMAAADALDRLGARPAGSDVAARWRALAAARGIAPSPPDRGRALGPAYQEGTLPPRGDVASQQVFLAGQRAVVALVPEPGRPLAIRIGSADSSICAQTATPARALCSWLPVFTARVEIRVSNPGARPAHFYLVSN